MRTEAAKPQILHTGSLRANPCAKNLRARMKVGSCISQPSISKESKWSVIFQTFTPLLFDYFFAVCIKSRPLSSLGMKLAVVCVIALSETVKSEIIKHRRRLVHWRLSNLLQYIPILRCPHQNKGLLSPMYRDAPIRYMES